jgi:hypothetical protein
MNRNQHTTESRLAALALVAALVGGAVRCVMGSQPVPADLVTLRSVSGQFIVPVQRSVAPAAASASLATNQDLVQLEPTFVTVSCERIKQRLLRELDVPGPWQGPVYIALYPARLANDSITIDSVGFKNGWQYRVEMPDIVERPRYVRAIVQVLLFELANRTAQAHSAEIPYWLVEGFTQMLLASNEAELILPPPRRTANGVSVSATTVNARKETFQQQAQRKLHGRPPLNFEGLSWPSDQDLASETGDVYSGSAQLFVGELLRMPDGRACLRAMLAQLPQHYNWQVSFLDAFQAHFSRPLDVEKWWSLSLNQAAGRGGAQDWPVEESWQRFDQALHISVQVRTGPHELPQPAEVTVQQIVREWDLIRQTQALNCTLRDLSLLRPHIAPEYAGLVREYAQAIELYLQQRDHNGSILPFVRNANRRRAIETAVQQLDALDAQRALLRPPARPASASQASNRPGALP